MKCFSAVNFIICFFSILSFINVLNIPELIYSRSGSERIYGLIGNPNYFAYMIFINIILINIYKEYFSKYKFIIYQLILTFAVIFSLSRGVLIGLFFFYLLINVRALTIKKISLFICVVCVLFSVVNFSVDSDMIINTINYRIDNLINGDGSGRFDIWAIGFESISSHLDKIITGVGPNMFGTYAHSLGLNNTTHNSFLRLFFELGIFGFGLFFVMMGYFFKKIECISLNMKIAIAVGVSFSWLSNDFILNKETWVLLAMLVSYDTLKREEYN
ncbi:O-antigen ligase family protein [Photobacterium kishitanii]|uniref:O-antigen ligase family protein n=1 Tax=Photobacterium kishitanii TaxID=318456 RepID=UPI001364ACFF|nr:O-antigen ligase family protein [Photobacterium kishitanii]